jgi:hypothetical protein
MHTHIQESAQELSMAKPKVVERSGIVPAVMDCLAILKQMAVKQPTMLDELEALMFVMFMSVEGKWQIGQIDRLIGSPLRSFAVRSIVQERALVRRYITTVLNDGMFAPVDCRACLN